MRKMLLSGSLLFVLFSAAAFAGAGAGAVPDEKDVPTPFIKFAGSSVTFASNIPSCH